MINTDFLRGGIVCRVVIFFVEVELFVADEMNQNGEVTWDLAIVVSATVTVIARQCARLP